VDDRPTADERMTDRRYEELRGYPSAGRRAVAGSRFTL